MELVAELRAGGGRAREVRVRCAAEAGGEPRAELRELRRGLAELQQRVAELLAPLVLEQQRRGAAGGAPGGGGGLKEEEEEEEEEEEDEDEGEEENGVDAARAELPPPKRTKVQPP